MAASKLWKCRYLVDVRRNAIGMVEGAMGAGLQGLRNRLQEPYSPDRRIKESEGAQFQSKGGFVAFDHGGVHILG